MATQVYEGRCRGRESLEAGDGPHGFACAPRVTDAQGNVTQQGGVQTMARALHYDGPHGQVSEIADPLAVHSAGEGEERVLYLHDPAGNLQERRRQTGWEAPPCPMPCGDGSNPDDHDGQCEDGTAPECPEPEPVWQPDYYSYDALDRLAAVARGPPRREGLGPVPPAEREALGVYGYNADGLRTRVRESGRNADAWYDGLALLLERVEQGSAAPTMVRYHHDTGGLHAITAEHDGAGYARSTHFAHRDGMGSTLAVSRPDVGALGLVAASYHTDPWGLITDEEGADHVNHSVFTGHQHDFDTGLIYMRARHYDPALGQFLSADSWLGDAQNPPSLQRYLYAYGNPGSWWDPDGRTPLLLIPIVVGALFLADDATSAERAREAQGLRKERQERNAFVAKHFDDDRSTYERVSEGILDAVLYEGRQSDLRYLLALTEAGQADPMLALAASREIMEGAGRDAAVNAAALVLSFYTGGRSHMALRGAMITRQSTTFTALTVGGSRTLSPAGAALAGGGSGAVAGVTHLGVQDIGHGQFSGVGAYAGTAGAGFAIGGAVGGGLQLGARAYQSHQIQQRVLGNLQANRAATQRSGFAAASQRWDMRAQVESNLAANRAATQGSGFAAASQRWTLRAQVTSNLAASQTARASSGFRDASRSWDSAATRGGSTASALTAAASRALAAVGPGRGSVYGTRAHSAFRAEVDSLGRGNLSTEVSYRHGAVVPYGTRGSVRLDVVEGPLSAPSAIYDFKTGSAALSPSRIRQIRGHLPGGGSNVPVLEIR